MKQFQISFAILLMSGLFFSSCTKEVFCIHGDGLITTKVLSIPEFTGIALEEAADVVITQGPVQEVKATGHANIIDRLRDKVVGGTWQIDLGKGCFSDYDLTLYITVPNIEDISISGAGTVTVNDFTEQSDLSLDISGAGNLELHQFEGAESLSIHISGLGGITGNGAFPSLKKLDMNISGSGNYDGYPIETEDCRIDISGSGNCKVSVIDHLDVSISGTGKVYYKGNPTINQQISGLGSLVHVN
ncbi:MAG: DUF2807 domain-containing protein [Lewinellaceae bacterium]|nr:DUF2807 domain-containing protein [Lewinellaceae bacterium]